MRIADNALEESFFTAGDNLAATATTQFDLVPVAVEDRKRRLKALGITAVIFCLVLLVFGIFVPAEAAPADRAKPARTDHSATL